MGNTIKILDCTLRDGGYVNDWCFGKETAKSIISSIDHAGCEYIEVGFLRQEKYNEGRMVFDNVHQVDKIFPERKSKQAVMLELGYDYPLSKIPNRTEASVSMIRVMIWKRMINEGVDYCKMLLEKGYEVGVQATRTDEYSEEEFTEFIKLYNKIKPTAIYIVDSFGLMNKEQVLRYAFIADRFLSKDIIIGYHAHNNLQQAYTNSVYFIEHDWQHDIMLDASVLGMGRGAGNLPLELICKYLVDNRGADYDIASIINAAEKLPNQGHLWGYSIPYMLSALYGINPSFVNFFIQKGCSYSFIARIFSDMKYRGVGVKFDSSVGDKYLNDVCF